MNNYVKYSVLILLLLILVLAFVPFRKTCTDLTPYDSCSKNKPFYCDNGTLVEKASVCGCSYNYILKDEKCEKIQRCADRTVYGKCSLEKPFYCDNGTLTEKSSLCGCPADEAPQNEKCASIYVLDPSLKSFKYVLRGEKGKINFQLSSGMNNYLSALPRYYYCTPECPSDRDLELRFIDEAKQKSVLAELADSIKEKTSSRDDQARIAISLVQKIPYDSASASDLNITERYPYEVIYDNTGICGEKSRLLVFLLRELGYETALFDYDAEKHMAAAVKCPLEYSHNNTGYCFIESTKPAIITDDQGSYGPAGKLYSAPKIIVISDGDSFNASEEYADARKWIRISNVSSSELLNMSDYKLWLSIAEKYDIQFILNETNA